MFGNTDDEIRTTVKEIDIFSKKIAKFFRILFIILSLLEVVLLMQFLDANIFVLIMIGVLGLLSSYYLSYGMGYIWGWGFIMTKYWMLKKGIRKRDVTSFAGTTVTISYLLGGKKAAKTSIYFMLTILLLTLTVGFYYGLYKYIKMREYLKVELISS